MPDSAPIHVVIITLDNHLSGAVERAAARFAKDGSGITIGFHAAADWEASPHALDTTLADIGRADIVLATMLFLDDHIRAVMPAITARRDHTQATIGMMSGAEIVKLTKMGSYRMDAPAKGPLALLKKLRGSSKPGASAGAKQMKMLRRLPKMLRFIPGTAQDVRAYFLTLQYWLAGSDDNVVNMIRALVDRYATGERGGERAQAPREYPEVGVYHPDLADRMSDRIEALAPPEGAIGTVGVLMLRSYILARDAAHYDGVIRALEAKGLRVIPAFAGGLDSRPAIEKFFVRDGAPIVDAVVSLTGFSLVGGPAYNDSDAAEATLTKLDVPYVAAHPVEFQSLEQWGAGRQGLLPLEATMMVAIPELDGATAPSIFGGRSDGAGVACTGCHHGCTFPTAGLVRTMHSCPERAQALAAKVARTIVLRRTPRAERRIATVLFNFPPNAGATGTAAHLAVWESLHATLLRMRDEGYTVDVPTDVDTLRDAVLKGNAERFGTDANVHARISADDHVRRERWLSEIEGNWGPAPGKVQSDGRNIQVLGAQFGNVFVGVQPTFGWEGDPMRILFEGRFTPTHAFSAFYRWLREDFAAHAVLHFGTHGALEFMPGKQAGMSGACWPERLIGDLPNLYIYAANNPSEGLLAKRRSGATLISYLTPPLAQAGLYKGLNELKALIERWRSSTEGTERQGLEPMIRDCAVALDLAPVPSTVVAIDPRLRADDDGCGVSDGLDIAALSARLYELECELIPHGLHVIGKKLDPAERRAWANQIAAGNADSDASEIDRLLEANDELGGVIHALDGGFIAPAPGGDLIRNPQVLPTGRNLHGFDPFRIPGAYACVEGVRAAEGVIARHMADGASFPETLALVLWGTDNLKSEGQQVAQALALLGARPRFDGYGRLSGSELIPLAELGRPRIDVVVTLSGIFRDLLPLQTRMIAEAAWLAASADEPLEQNFVRKHTLAHQAAHGCDLETAALRVFSNAEGAYGANVNQMIDAGGWSDPDELAEMFERNKGFAYGRKGAPERRAELFKSALAGVDATYQNLDSVELGVTDIDQYVDALGGMSRSIARAKGKAAPVYIVDATQGAAKVRTLGEQVDLETRTRMLNPVWYEGMLKHGFEGVRQIEGHVTTTMGWSATTGQVAPWVYQKISETYMLDDAMRQRLATLNPKASARVASRLIEASERDFWQPDAETLAALHAASDEIEDMLEGVAAAA
ncbi:magnesium chelatase subunit H [Sphingomonas qomolangmaensis]|uniref:magnesium chelatase n=1 Tax=Sphingomonas qomolangmaensis TaxID=2918765 RepID=A0ABY5LBA7_9SPHN|nr:magnesium chelatase subunit H [Sphingomonas qomolangmaensis]UUL83074.1 magnesium chelatase subunit H [Sphingomonas qomolangmaensis]